MSQLEIAATPPEPVDKRPRMIGELLTNLVARINRNDVKALQSSPVLGEGEPPVINVPDGLGKKVTQGADPRFYRFNR